MYLRVHIGIVCRAYLGETEKKIKTKKTGVFDFYDIPV